MRLRFWTRVGGVPISSASSCDLDGASMSSPDVLDPGKVASTAMLAHCCRPAPAPPAAANGC